MTGLGKYYNLERLFVEFGRDDFILRELGIGGEGTGRKSISRRAYFR